MRVLPFFGSVLALMASAAPAFAKDDAPPAPAAPVAPPPPPVAPTAAERVRVVEQLPPTVAPAPAPAPRYDMVAVYSPRPAVAAAPVAACSDCFEPRDACGWAIDDCGNRLGRFDVTLLGMVSFVGSPDGILGEDLFVAGNHLDWNDVDYAGEFGGRIGMSYRVLPQSRVEAVGTYYGSPDDTNVQRGQFAARPGVTGLGDISRIVDATFTSEAEAFTLELNFWSEVSCSDRWRIDAGIGARYVSFDEQANVGFVTDAQNPGPFPIANGFVNSDVQNRFYGGQLALAAHYDANSCWTFNSSLKVMLGSLDRELVVTDDSIFAGGTHVSSEGDDEFVLGVNFELSAMWRLAEHVSLRAGYDLFVLDNVQRAEDGMDFSNSNSGAVQATQDPDQLVIHSLFFGVTFTF
jgi:hypothetical protein